MRSFFKITVLSLILGIPIVLDTFGYITSKNIGDYGNYLIGLAAILATSIAYYEYESRKNQKRLEFKSKFYLSASEYLSCLSYRNGKINKYSEKNKLKDIDYNQFILDIKSYELPETVKTIRTFNLTFRTIGLFNFHKEEYKFFKDLSYISTNFTLYFNLLNSLYLTTEKKSEYFKKLTIEDNDFKNFKSKVLGYINMLRKELSLDQLDHEDIFYSK